MYSNTLNVKKILEYLIGMTKTQRKTRILGMVGTEKTTVKNLICIQVFT